MSNIKRTERDVPLSYTVAAGVLTTTHGKMAVTKAAEATIGTNARGTVAPAAAPAAAGAHFHLVTFGATRRPARYIDVMYRATGTAEASVDTQVIVEFYHEDSALWVAAEPFQALGSTALLSLTNYSVGEIRTIKVPRGAIAGRFYIPTLAANQGLDLVVDADNDD